MYATSPGKSYEGMSPNGQHIHMHVCQFDFLGKGKVRNMFLKNIESLSEIKKDKNPSP